MVINHHCVSLPYAQRGGGGAKCRRLRQHAEQAGRCCCVDDAVEVEEPGAGDAAGLEVGDAGLCTRACRRALFDEEGRWKERRAGGSMGTQRSAAQCSGLMHRLRVGGRWRQQASQQATDLGH